MSVPQAPAPAKAVVSLVMKDKALLTPAARGLCRLLGDIELISDYYTVAKHVQSLMVTNVILPTAIISNCYW